MSCPSEEAFAFLHDLTKRSFGPMQIALDGEVEGRDSDSLEFIKAEVTPFVILRVGRQTLDVSEALVHFRVVLGSEPGRFTGGGEKLGDDERILDPFLTTHFRKACFELFGKKFHGE